MAKNDANKLLYDTIPPEVLKEIVAVLTFGVQKYGKENWKNTEDFESRFYNALMRHLESWRSGEDYNSDDEQRLHLTHVCCNAVFLLWYQLSKKCFSPVRPS